MTPREERGNQLRKPIREFPSPQANGHDVTLDLAKYEQNDIGNALRFIALYGHVLRFVVNVGWYAWDGRRWARDEGDVVARHCAQQTAKAILGELAHLSDKDALKARFKWAITSGYNARLKAMLAQSEPHLALTVDQLDSDPWIFNCLNGSINLRSGELFPHDPSKLITKLCEVEYSPDAVCPMWHEFLGNVFNNDAALIGFLHRALGYSLTGITREHALFMLHGTGSNGKSVLLETVAAIFCDYGRQCPADTFLAKDSGSGGISNDIARLAGARFVSVVETEQDKRLAESLVKQSTGGDRMAARYMHKEFFEFLPGFKLWFATNHKPRIRGTDHGIWRRIKLLPFLVTFHEPSKAPLGAKVQDDTLIEKLKTELPGILAAIVRGCTDWQDVGLNEPKTVEDATQNYRHAQDRTAAFIDDCCDLYPTYHCRSALAYATYRKWCGDNGETPMAANIFGEKLGDKGFTPDRGTGGIRIWKGFDIKEELKSRKQDVEQE